MFCPKCGNKVKSDLRYCHVCGYDLHNINDLDSETNNEKDINHHPDNESNTSDKTTPIDDNTEKEAETNFVEKLLNAKVVLICFALIAGLIIILTVSENIANEQQRYSEKTYSNNNRYSETTSVKNESSINSEKSSDIRESEPTQVVTSNLESLADTSKIDDNPIGSSSNEDELSELMRSRGKLYKVGESAIVGPLEFTLVDAYEAQKDDFDGYKKIPEGATYLVIEYKYKNISKEPISPPDPFTFQIPIYVSFEDYNGVTYGIDYDASNYLGSASDEKMVSSLNPGITTKASKVYEIAIDTTLQKGNAVRVRFEDKDGDKIVYFTVDDVWNRYKSNDYNDSSSTEQKSTTSSGLYDPLLKKVGNMYACFNGNDKEIITIEYNDDEHARLFLSYTYNNVSGTEEYVLERYTGWDNEEAYGYELVGNTRRGVSYNENADTLKIFDKYGDTIYTRYNKEESDRSTSTSQVTGSTNYTKKEILGKYVSVNDAYNGLEIHTGNYYDLLKATTYLTSGGYLHSIYSQQLNKLDNNKYEMSDTGGILTIHGNGLVDINGEYYQKCE